MRTLVYEEVRDNLARAVIEPLHADAFLVLSSGHHAEWYDKAKQPLQPIGEAEMLAAARSLDASSLVILNEAAALTGSGAARVGRHHIQRSLVVRWGVCLAEVTAAEARRPRPYTWVLRARPDAHYRCHLCLPPPAAARGLWAAVARDFAVLMSRAAAEVALGAPDERIATCNVRSPRWAVRREEWCTPCVLWHANGTVLTFGGAPTVTALSIFRPGYAHANGSRVHTCFDVDPLLPSGKGRTECFSSALPPVEACVLTPSVRGSSIAFPHYSTGRNAPCRRAY